MGSGVRDVVGGERQQRIERRVPDPESDAERREEQHCQPHVERRIGRSQPRVLLEEDEPRVLDAGVEGRARRGRGEQIPDHHQVLGHRGVADHRLADEPRREREARDRQRADRPAERRQRHRAEQPSEVGAFAPPGRVQHRARRHQQQRLVEDVGERMRCRAVECRRRADADAGDHEPDLVDDAVGQDAPHVVLQQRIDDAVEHHDETDVDQDLGAGKRAQEHVDRGLGRERRKEHGAAPRRLGIGIGNPGGQRPCAGVHEKSGEDQPMRGRVQRKTLEGDRARFGDVPRDPRHQQHASAQVHRRIAQARAVRGRSSRTPDDGGRPDRHDFPESEGRHQVAGERDADRRTRVDHRRGHLEPVLLVEREQPAAERRDRENQGEQARKAIHGERDEVEAEKARPPQHAFRKRERDGDRRRRGAEHDRAARPAAQRPGGEAGSDEQQTGVQKVNHRCARHRSSCPAA